MCLIFILSIFIFLESSVNCSSITAICLYDFGDQTGKVPNRVLFEKGLKVSIHGDHTIFNPQSSPDCERITPQIVPNISMFFSTTDDGCCYLQTTQCKWFKPPRQSVEEHLLGVVRKCGYLEGKIANVVCSDYNSTNHNVINRITVNSRNLRVSNIYTFGCQRGRSFSLPWGQILDSWLNKTISINVRQGLVHYGTDHN